jgi:hypothetical protein
VTPVESVTNTAMNLRSEPYSGITMKYKVCFLVLATMLAGTLPTFAATIHARWNDLCQVARNRPLSVTTSDGQTVNGACTSTDADVLSLNSNQRIVKIARATLTRIQLYQPGNHHLADLGRGMSKGFQTGFGWLFSPAAPLGLVVIPATVAWGAMAAPFCLLGDLADNGPVTQEIKVIN